jgi:hypothetical protein
VSSICVRDACRSTAGSTAASTKSLPIDWPRRRNQSSGSGGYPCRQQAPHTKVRAVCWWHQDIPRRLAYRKSRSLSPCGCSLLDCSFIRSTTLITRISSSGSCSRIMATAASVSSVGTSPRHAITTSGSLSSSLLAHGQRRLAWRLKRAKFVPPAMRCVPKGRGDPAQTSAYSLVCETYWCNSDAGRFDQRCHRIRGHSNGTATPARCGMTRAV